MHDLRFVKRLHKAAKTQSAQAGRRKQKGKGRKKSSPARALYIACQKHTENLPEKMRAKIGGPECRELRSRRMQVIEPAFSNIACCKGMGRFTLGGEKKADAQWKLYCIVHNIGKCARALSHNHLHSRWIFKFH
jgi:hypothetical protein